MANDVGIEIFVDSVDAVKGAKAAKEELGKLESTADNLENKIKELKGSLDEVDGKKATDGAKKLSKEWRSYNSVAGSTVPTNKKVSETTKKIGSEAARTGEKLKDLKTSAKEAAEGLKNVKEKSDLAGDSFNSLKTAIAAVFTIGAATKALTLADNFNILQQRIKTATKASGDFKKVSEEVFKISQKNGTALQTNVELFQSLARVAPELGATTNEMLTLTDAVGKLGVIGGASTEAMKNGILQFTQGLAAGTFRAEEFNSILDNIPEVAARIAGGMGLSFGELRKLVLEGELLSKDVFSVLLSQSKDIAEEFASMPLTLERATTNLENSVLKALGSIDQQIGATTTLAGVINQLGTSLEGLADHSDAIVNVGGVIVTLVGAKMVGAFAASTVATIANTAATIKNIATVQAATVTRNAYSGAIVRTAAVTSAATVAATGLRAALAFIGGPVGLAVIAAAGIYQFATSGDDASESTEELIKRVNGLNKSFEDLKITKAENALSDISDKIRSLGGHMHDLRESNFTKFKSWFGESIPAALQRSNEEITLLAEVYKTKYAELEALKRGQDDGSSDTLAGSSQAYQDFQGDETTDEGKDSFVGPQVELVGPRAPDEHETQLQEQLERLQESLLTEEDTLRNSYERQREIVEASLAGQDEAQRKLYDKLKKRYDLDTKNLKQKRLQEKKMQLEHENFKLKTSFEGFGIHSKMLYQFATIEKKTNFEKAKFAIDVSSSLLGQIGKDSIALFNIQKALNLSDAIMNGYGAIQKALNSAPPPWNFAAAAAVAVKTAVQVKGIQSQQFGGGSAPSFSGGGISQPPTLSTLPDLQNAFPAFEDALKTNAIEDAVAANDPLQTTEEKEPTREIKVNISLEETIDKIDPDALLTGAFVRSLLEKVQDEIENNVNINLSGEAA